MYFVPELLLGPFTTTGGILPDMTLHPLPVGGLTVVMMVQSRIRIGRLGS